MGVGGVGGGVVCLNSCWRNRRPQQPFGSFGSSKRAAEDSLTCLSTGRCWRLPSSSSSGRSLTKNEGKVATEALHTADSNVDYFPMFCRSVNVVGRTCALHSACQLFAIFPRRSQGKKIYKSHFLFHFQQTSKATL